MSVPRAIAAMLLVAGLLGCHGESDEDRVKGVIEEARAAVVDRDAGGVLEHVAEEYRDPQGRTKRELRALLLYHILRNRRVSVSVVAPRVIVSGTTAAARVRVVATGNEGGGLFPDNATSRDFDLRFRRENGAWKLVSAVWETQSAE